MATRWGRDYQEDVGGRQPLEHSWEEQLQVRPGRQDIRVSPATGIGYTTETQGEGVRGPDYRDLQEGVRTVTGRGGGRGGRGRRGRRGRGRGRGRARATPQPSPQPATPEPVPPQTGGPEPLPPGGPSGPVFTGWSGHTVTRTAGGGWSPVGAAPQPPPSTTAAGYPGAPSYPRPGQEFPLPGAPGGPTGPGPWGSGYGYGGAEPWKTYGGYGQEVPSTAMPPGPGAGWTLPSPGGASTTIPTSTTTPTVPRSPAPYESRVPPGGYLPGGRLPEWGPEMADPRMAHNALTRRGI